MKRFEFRLESVLRIRNFELDRARIHLAKVEQERRRRAAVVADFARRLVEGRALLEAETNEGADAHRLVMRAEAISAGRFRLARAERSLGELAETLNQARRRVKHAFARARSLERLREQAEDTHKREGLAFEQSELEELAISRIARERAAARQSLEESTR